MMTTIPSQRMVGQLSFNLIPKMYLYISLRECCKVILIAGIKTHLPPPHTPSTHILDLQKILHEEKESSREEGWKFLRKNDLCEVWCKNEEDKPVHLIKVRGRARSLVVFAIIVLSFGYIKFGAIVCSSFVLVVNLITQLKSLQLLFKHVTSISDEPPSAGLPLLSRYTSRQK